MTRVTIDLRRYNLDTKADGFKAALRKGMVASGFHLEREAKKKSPVQTGLYRSRWDNRGSRGNQLVVDIVNDVVYAGWVEDGADSPFAPRKLRGSSFHGHKVAQRTVNENEDAVGRIISGVVRGHLR